MLRHLIIYRLLPCCVFSLILILVEVAGHFSIVFILASDRWLFDILRCRGLHFKYCLIHVVFDEVLLFATLDFVELVSLGHLFFLWYNVSLTA